MVTMASGAVAGVVLHQAPEGAGSLVCPSGLENAHVGRLASLDLVWLYLLPSLPTVLRGTPGLDLSLSTELSWS